MLASGPLGLTVLCLFQAGAQLEAGARLETLAGEMPTGSTVMIMATPSLRLDWFEGTDLLQADLSTRVLWRPYPFPRTRPLFLETLGLVHSVRPTLRSQWRFDLRASYGEQDYTSLSRQFNNQPTLPQATTMFMINSVVDTSWRSSRRTTLALRLGAAHRRSLEDQGSSGQSAGASNFPPQTMVTAAPEMRFAMSRRLLASVSAPLSLYDVSTNSYDVSSTGVSRNTTSFSVQPQIGLHARLSRRDLLRLAAGLTYAGSIRGPTTDSGHFITPLGLIGFDSNIYQSRSSTVRSFVEASTGWYLDPVLGRGILRGLSQAGVDAQVGLRWSTGLRFSSAVDISKQSSPSGLQNDGTMISVDSFLRYRWTNVLVVELGGRFAERGPHLSSSDFAWRSREAWGFLTLYTASRMTLTSARSPRSLSGSGI